MNASSRVTQVGAASAVVLSLAVGAGAWLGQPAVKAADVRTAAAAKFTLELEGNSAGALKSVEGGEPVATAVLEAGASAGVVKKHPSSPRYTDLMLETGFDQRDVAQWITDMFAGKVSRKDGAVVSLDFNYKATEQLQFTQALLSSVTLPTLDAAGKDAGYLLLGLSPQQTRVVPGSGQSSPMAGAKTKAWLTSNFRVELDGLDTSRVVKVEGFTVKQTVAAEAVGAARDPSKVAGKFELPNLVLVVNGDTADAFRSWHTDFVVKGNSSDEKEKSGAIVLLGPDLKSEIARISLSHVGVLSVRSDKRAANSDALALVRVELYVESMAFAVPGVTK